MVNMAGLNKARPSIKPVVAAVEWERLDTLVAGPSGVESEVAPTPAAVGMVAAAVDDNGDGGSSSPLDGGENAEMQRVARRVEVVGAALVRAAAERTWVRTAVDARRENMVGW